MPCAGTTRCMQAAIAAARRATCSKRSAMRSARRSRGPKTPLRRSSMRSATSLQRISQSIDGLRVRAAVHTGTADERDGDYFGPARQSRRASASDRPRRPGAGLGASPPISCRATLPPQASLRDLGEHRLSDLARPEHVYQLLAPDLARDFPPLALARHPPEQLAAATQVLRRARGGDRRNHVAYRAASARHAGRLGRRRQDAPLVASRGQSARRLRRRRVVHRARSADQRRLHSIGTVAQALGLTLRGRGRSAREPRSRAQGKARAARLRQLRASGRARRARDLGNSARLPRRSRFSHRAVKDWELPEKRRIRCRRSTFRRRRSGAPQVDRLLRHEAVALFVERAWAASDSFSLTDENAPIVADICRRLDGIPLAIELAAARVKMLSPKQLRDRLDERFRVLTGGSRDVLPRQQTLRALDRLEPRPARRARAHALPAAGDLRQRTSRSKEPSRSAAVEGSRRTRRLRRAGVAGRQVAGVGRAARRRGALSAARIDARLCLGEARRCGRTRSHCGSPSALSARPVCRSCGTAASKPHELPISLRRCRPSWRTCVWRSTVHWRVRRSSTAASCSPTLMPGVASHRTRGGRLGAVRGVSRGASGGRVATARSALSRVVVLASAIPAHKVRAFELATEAVEDARASGDAPLLAGCAAIYAYAVDGPPSFDEGEGRSASRSDRRDLGCPSPCGCSKRVRLQCVPWRSRDGGAHLRAASQRAPLARKFPAERRLRRQPRRDRTRARSDAASDRDRSRDACRRCGPAPIGTLFARPAQQPRGLSRRG